MDQPSASQLLTDQHRQTDTGILGIAEGTGQLSALAQSLALLRLHIYVEEAFLFAPLEAAGLGMPVFVMKREHGQMWPLLQTLTDACATNAAVTTLREPARTLFQLLQMHNPKEEQIVYTAVNRLVAEQSDGQLAHALETTAVPEGWACAAAPR